MKKERAKLLTEARKLIDRSLRFDLKVKDETLGVLFGAVGAYMTAALIYDKSGDKAAVAKYVDRCKQLCEKALLNKDLFWKHGSDELSTGRSGDRDEVGQATDHSDRRVGYGIRETSRFKVAVDVRLRQEGATRISSRTFGYTDDVPQFPTVDLDAHQTTLLKGAVDWLCSLQDDDGNFPADTTEGGASALVRWRDGAPGMVHLLARAYQIWHEDRYLQAAFKIGDLVWERGLSKRGPSVSEGIAGNAYVFMVLYRVTGYTEEQHLHRALQFVSFLRTEEVENSILDKPYSLFEGFAGALCLYADLASGFDHRDDWEFPLLPMF